MIVGANGSGKSRLGAWFENPGHIGPSQNPNRQAHRISAQRSIELPSPQRIDTNVAKEQFARGSAGPAGNSNSRVAGDPIVGTLNDFNTVVNALFAERASVAAEYLIRGRSTGGHPGEPPTDTLNQVLEIWTRIFPERKLAADDYKIEARVVGSNKEFPATAMSDGERVGFYLVSQTLLAPKNSRIVIDEPELHLHESIQSSLWDALEAARTDCTFIYITHDLAFAASRIGAPRVVLLEYIAPNLPTDVGEWKWLLIPSSQFLPEDVGLKIHGSRRPVLFVEGQIGSLDQRIFEALYTDRLVVPSGSWEAVDRSVRTYRQIPHLHHLKVVGFIDRDDRDVEEIQGLAEQGIFVLPVGTIENILATDSVMTAVGQARKLTDPEIQKAKVTAMQRVLKALTSVREATIAERAQYSVRRRMGAIVRQNNSKESLIEALNVKVTQINASAIFDAAELMINSALGAATLKEQYGEALKVFRNSAIIHEVANAFSISTDDYINITIDLLRQQKGSFKQEMLSLLPALE